MFPCGCFYISNHVRHYLPLVCSKFHGTVRSNTAHTALTQTFSNPTKNTIEKCKYTFPLYEGLSVVGFSCRVGDKVLTGVVKEKEEAKADFDNAVSRGESAGLLEQSEDASDVFSTSLGNVAAGQTVLVEINYVAELKNDVDVDGLRLTIPTIIAPRYGEISNVNLAGDIPATSEKGIKITVDVIMPEGSPIRSLQSPSHPISLELGALSTDKENLSLNKACATLSLGEAALEKDFVLMIKSEDVGLPKAILERHPTLKDHRALCATLVPKFSLPEIRPEIVFIADRSGSMAGNIPMLKSAMQIFLRSLPMGTKFNICSFGSSYSFLWPKSQSYTREHLDQSLSHVDSFNSNYGGTETLNALRATIEGRLGDIPLEIILLTDGDIWQQEEAFKYINEQVQASDGHIRLFPLGIGNGVSHALIEGLARAGRGFAQAVQDGERMDGRVVRMLKGALSPHITDYSLEIKYEKENDDDDDFEIIEKVSDSLKVMVVEDPPTGESPTKKQKGDISFFDSSVNPDKESRVENYLPEVTIPKLLQAPHQIPPLFSFSRATVYHLMSPSAIQRNPTSVVFRATSTSGPLSLEIPVQVLEEPSSTIHSLAARKAAQDLEEGRGWLHDALDKNDSNQKIKDKFPSRFDDLVKREAVRLGTTFQVANRWCSFVAVSADESETTSEAPANASGIDESNTPKVSFTQASMAPASSARPQYRQYFNPAPPASHPRTSSGVVRTNYQQLSFTGSRGGRGGGHGPDPRGFGRGGAMRHRRIISANDSAASNDASSPVSGASFPSRFDCAPSANLPATNSFIDDDDDDVGFGLLDDDGPAQISPAQEPYTEPPRRTLAMKSCRKVVDSNDNEEEEEEEEESAQGRNKSMASSIPSPKKRKMPGSTNKAAAVVDASTMSVQAVVHELISLQEFEGCWATKDGVRIAQLMGCGNDALAAGDMDKDVWITALVVGFMEEKLKAEKSVWEMIVEKAVAWLEGQLARDEMEKVLEKAKGVVGRVAREESRGS